MCDVYRLMVLFFYCLQHESHRRPIKCNENKLFLFKNENLSHGNVRAPQGVLFLLRKRHKLLDLFLMFGDVVVCLNVLISYMNGVIEQFIRTFVLAC